MSDLLADGMIYLLARPGRVSAALVAVTLLGVVANVVVKRWDMRP